ISASPVPLPLAAMKGTVAGSVLTGAEVSLVVCWKRIGIWCSGAAARYAVFQAGLPPQLKVAPDRSTVAAGRGLRLVAAAKITREPPNECPVRAIFAGSTGLTP